MSGMDETVPTIDKSEPDKAARLGVTLLDIQCSRPQTAVYYAGEKLEGQVVLEVSRDLQVEDIVLVVRGFSQVLIAKHRFSKEHLTMKSKIFQELSRGDGTIIVPRGRHTSPFQFAIPDKCPGSFVAVRGGIIYSTECIIQINRNQVVHSRRPLNFNIYENVDLNQVLKSQSPPEFRTAVAVPQICCRTSEVDVQLTLNQPGYIPGEEIIITGEIANNSGSRIKKAYVSLIQNIAYFAFGHKSEWKREVARGNIIWKNLTGSAKIDDSIIVPNVPMSTHHPEAIIVISYTVKLTMKPSNPVLMNIVIGSWPLLNPQGVPTHQTERSDRVIPQMVIPNTITTIRTRPTSNPRARKRTNFTISSNNLIRARWPH